ncbi:glycerate kinase, partial [Bacillus altitudinis]|uniref:glycerate kinase n=1 Tax=Bacillus altitudinis TaxID=293387 RepID=UPI0023541A66
RGRGELMVGGVDKGGKHLMIGVGGRGRNDGGVGMMEGLGGCFLDKGGEEVRPGGG